MKRLRIAGLESSYGEVCWGQVRQCSSKVCRWSVVKHWGVWRIISCFQSRSSLKETRLQEGTLTLDAVAGRRGSAVSVERGCLEVYAWSAAVAVEEGAAFRRWFAPGFTFKVL